MSNFSYLDEELCAKALKKSLARILQEISYDEFLLDVEHGDYSRFPQDYHWLFEKWIDRKRPKSLYVFITINLRDDSYLQSFIHAVHKSSGKVWIRWFVYSFEQRSIGGPEYKGYHCHMLLHRGTKTPSVVVSEFRSTFRTLVNTDNSHCLNFKWIPRDVVDKKIAYILGEKQEKKRSLVERDNEMRQYHGLLSHYCSESSPCPCRNSKNQEEIDSILTSDLPDTQNALCTAEELPSELSEKASTSSQVSAHGGVRDGIEST